MPYEITISGINTKFNKCIDWVTCKVDTPATSNARTNYVGNYMNISGFIGTDEATIDLYQWAILPINESNVCRNVELAVKDANDNIIEKVSFPNAFVQYYKESYSRDKGLGKFDLQLKQRIDKNGDIVVSEASAEEKLKNSQDQDGISKKLTETVADTITAATLETTTTELQKAKVLANQVLERAKSSEQKVTNMMKSFEVEGAHLEGLEYRLKSVDSLTRKIMTDSHIDGIPLRQAADNIGDSLRYTLVADEGNYAKVAKDTLQKLEQEGYTISKFKNFWGNEIYQGINTSIITPDGVKMELQFHTAESYKTKEVLNHKHYEIFRSETATTDEKMKAYRIMTENQAKVNVPKGIKDITWKGGQT